MGRRHRDHLPRTGGCGVTTSALDNFHHPHPWLGRQVRDGATGKTGVLCAIAPEPDDGPPKEPVVRLEDRPPVAWLRPVGGGREWTTDPNRLEALHS